MTELSVSTPALRTTAARLRDAVSVADEVSGSAGRLRRLGEGVGDGAAADAVDGFLSAWSYGLGLVADDARTLADLLAGAATAYDRLESSLVRSCRG